MILDLFSYFAKFPSKSGVLSIFTNGSSTYAQYSELHNVITNLPEPFLRFNHTFLGNHLNLSKHVSIT